MEITKGKFYRVKKPNTLGSYSRWNDKSRPSTYTKVTQEVNYHIIYSRYVNGKCIEAQCWMSREDFMLNFEPYDPKTSDKIRKLLKCNTK